MRARRARSLATGKSKEKQDAMVAEACGDAEREGQWRGSLGRSLSAAAVACAAPNKHMEAVTGVSLQLRLLPLPHFSYAAWPARRWIMEEE